ncbi:MAG: lipid-A-disaccharide synthase [Bacteroidetes bacterium]|nr:MAG: lipid-A-disaccharide synthase [Bacteroidota bacterium]
MKYFFIVGEASGDLHASYLIKSIKTQDHEADVVGWGGDLMEAEGMKLLHHYKDSAFMGFVEVLQNLSTIKRNFAICKSDILEYCPDVLILVDYAGFNLKMAAFAKQNGIKVFYYIAPKTWAWKENRVKSLRKNVDQLYVIFPFEKDYFSTFHIPTYYLGNPLMDELDFEKTELEKETFFKRNNLDNRPMIALIPGSRNQEIQNLLPVMLSVTDHYPDYQFVIAGAPGQTEAIYQPIVKEKKIPVIFNQGKEIMKYASAALITSGTATLEAALFKLPHVICYKGNPITIFIGRLLIRSIKFIGLTNLVMDKSVNAELIQKEVNKDNLIAHLNRLLFDKDCQEQLKDDYEQLHQKMGTPGASQRIARHMIEALQK